MKKKSLYIAHLFPPAPFPYRITGNRIYRVFSIQKSARSVNAENNHFTLIDCDRLFIEPTRTKSSVPIQKRARAKSDEKIKGFDGPDSSPRILCLGRQTAIANSVGVTFE